MYLMDLPSINKYESIQRAVSDAYDVVNYDDDDFINDDDFSDELLLDWAM